MSRSIFEAIKQRIRLVEHFQSHYDMRLTSKGMTSCPFHEDKTPSFHVINDERWHCFSCGEGGDIVDFVAKRQSITIAEAARQLAGELNIELSPEEEARIKAFKELQDRNKKMLVKAQEELLDDLNADGYLTSRGIDKKAVEHFGLGYRPDCNAISIPIHDRLNRLVGYSLRLIAPKENEPKYKNSRADAMGLFQKREILFNLGACRAMIKERIYIVEGYFDVIALWQLGFPNVVGLCQAIMTKEQAKILHDAILPATEIVLVPDGDRAGIEALQKNLATLRAYSKERAIRVVQFRDAKDAGEAFVNNRDHARADIENSRMAETVVIDLLCEDEAERAKQYQLVRPIVSSVTPLLRDDLSDYLAEKWGKEKRIIAQYFGAEQKAADADSFAGPIDLYDNYLEYVRNTRRNGVRLGIPGIDRLVRRIAPGEVGYLQARTSVGKTAFMLNILGRLSQAGVQTLFFSLEQPKEQIYERMMQIANRRRGYEIENMVFSMDPDVAELNENFYAMFKNVHVVDKSSMTLGQIRDHINQFSAIHKTPQVIALDYFGYIKSEGRKDVYEASSERAKEIKAAAKDFNMAWFVLHQLSRSGGSGGEPVTLDMGRDSGVVEESADVMIGAWRPELEKDIDETERQRREAESVLMFSVLKNRSGPTGLVKLHFDKQTLVINDYESQQSYEPTAESQEEFILPGEDENGG